MPTILARSRWTSTSARGSSINWSRVRGLVAHYPAMGRAVGVLSQAQEAARLRGWRSYHVNTLGWKDIGYSYGIGQSGRIYSLRGDRVGGHTYGHNSTTMGVLFIVGDNEPLTAAAKASFRALRTTLRRRGAGAGIWGHTEMSGNNTRCPGPYIMGSIRDGSLRAGSGGTTPSRPTAPAADPSRPWSSSPRVAGMSTAEVKRIQKSLLGFGLDLGKWGADGKYGDATGTAVKTLQAELDLTADGVWGPSTQEAYMTIKDDIATIKRALEPGISGKRTDGEFASFIRGQRDIIRDDIKKVPARVLDEPVSLKGEWDGQKGTLRGVRAWYAEDMRKVRALLTESQAAIMTAVQESGRAQGLTDEQIQQIASAAAEASALVSAEDVAGQLDVTVRAEG